MVGSLIVFMQSIRLNVIPVRKQTIVIVLFCKLLLMLLRGHSPSIILYRLWLEKGVGISHNRDGLIVLFFFFITVMLLIFQMCVDIHEHRTPTVIVLVALI
jgi:hypothetical protein